MATDLSAWLKVSGKTLGIIGFGRIGRAVAHRAHHGFGMKILVQNRSAVAPEILAQCNATQVESIDALMPRCDFISLHCPGGGGKPQSYRRAAAEPDEVRRLSDQYRLRRSDR